MNIEERLIEIRKQVAQVFIEVEPGCLGVWIFKLCLHYNLTHKSVSHGKTIEEAVVHAEDWLVKSLPWRKI
jgi:hypothetical protein